MTKLSSSYLLQKLTAQLPALADDFLNLPAVTRRLWRRFETGLLGQCGTVSLRTL